jgi:hypothetical protein
MVRVFLRGFCFSCVPLVILKNRENEQLNSPCLIPLILCTRNVTGPHPRFPKFRFIHIVLNENFTGNVMKKMVNAGDIIDGRDVYSPPCVMRISDLNRGEGAGCSPSGSGDTSLCSPGNSTEICDTSGNNALSVCSNTGSGL